jgi:hypothetical protein
MDGAESWGVEAGSQIISRWFFRFMVLSFPMSTHIGDFAPLTIYTYETQRSGIAGHGMAWHGRNCMAVGGKGAGLKVSGIPA